MLDEKLKTASMLYAIINSCGKTTSMLYAKLKGFSCVPGRGVVRDDHNTVGTSSTQLTFFFRVVFWLYPIWSYWILLFGYWSADEPPIWIVVLCYVPHTNVWKGSQQIVERCRWLMFLVCQIEWVHNYDCSDNYEVK